MKISVMGYIIWLNKSDNLFILSTFFLLNVLTQVDMSAITIEKSLPCS